MAVKRRNKSVYISVYSYTIPAFWLKNPVFPGIFVSIYKYFFRGKQIFKLRKISLAISEKVCYYI